MRNNVFYLSPIDSHKSFYNKCYVVRDNNNVLTCYSYNTPVARFDGKFHRLWSGYSSTTMRHVNAFAAYCGIRDGGKKWWDSLELE